MSWSPAKPLESARAPTAVCVGCAQKSARYQPGLVVSLRPELLDGIDWIAPGRKVAVEYGHAAHAGMLRLTPGHSVQLAATGGKHGRSGVVVVRVQLPVGVKAQKVKPRPVEFDYAPGWVELTLPEWAVPVPIPQAASASPSAPAGPASTPRCGISDRVADPAAALRGAR